jgi:microcystin-dependent protein
MVDVEIGDVRWQGHSNQSIHDMICDGRSLVTTNYPDLFAKIGYNFGGSGTNFNIPNLQGIFPGSYGTQGTHGGAEVIGSLREDSIESHTHPFVGSALPTHFHTSGFSTGDEPTLFCAFGYRASPTQSSFSRTTGDGVYGAYTDVVSAGTPAGSVNAQADAGAETRPAALVGHWVIRVTQPAPYIFPEAPPASGSTIEVQRIDTTAGDVVVTFPASPTEGQQLLVKNVGTTPGFFALTIDDHEIGIGHSVMYTFDGVEWSYEDVELSYEIYLDSRNVNQFVTKWTLGAMRMQTYVAHYFNNSATCQVFVTFVKPFAYNAVANVNFTSSGIFVIAATNNWGTTGGSVDFSSLIADAHMFDNIAVTGSVNSVTYYTVWGRWK